MTELALKIAQGGVQAAHLTQVLVEHDPMGFGDPVGDTVQTPYASTAREIANLISRGSPMADALRKALSAQYGEDAVGKLDLGILTNNLE